MSGRGTPGDGRRGIADRRQASLDRGTGTDLIPRDSGRGARPGSKPGLSTPSVAADAMYDTIDQAALRRVDVHERTADATVYRKVDRRGPEGTAAERTAAVRSGRPPVDEQRSAPAAATRRVAGRGQRDRPTQLTERMAMRVGEAGAAGAVSERGTGAAGRPVAGRGGSRRPGAAREGRPGSAAPSTSRMARAQAGGPGGPDGPVPSRRRGGGRSSRPGQGSRGPMWWRRRPRWLRRLVLAGVFSSILLFVAGIAVIYAATRVPLPDEVKTAQTSIIYYSPTSAQQSTGDEMARLGTVNRTDVPLSQVSKAMQHAALAAEDKRFYSEPGISPKGIARALYVNLTGGDLQGGSTITQQYAKNAYLTQERTFTRKMREIVLAVKLDRKYSKDKILEFYLNTIFFGRNAYGIEAAAKAYFNTTAAQLTPEQGAVLAGLIRSPNYLDPVKNPGPAATRWHEVVATMAAEGWAPASITSAQPPPVIPKPIQNTADTSAQVAYIRDEVVRELTAAGITEQQIKQDGLRITTTIDQSRQIASFQAVNQVLSSAYAAVPDLRTGLSAVEPGTGRILAWYGGSLYGKDAQGREAYEDNVSGAQVQSASTFKTITLIAALQKNINLKSTYAAPAKAYLPGYVVENDESEGGDLGYKNLIEATAASINTVYVPLGQTIGVNNVIATARTLGIRDRTALKSEAGITLGQDSVYPIDMTSVYSVLASNGVRATPHIVDKVVDGNGQVIYSGAVQNPKQVIPAAVARDATYALQSVITDPSGTGHRAALEGGREAAGKTGTSTDFRSAWFCGYTKEIASCVDMFRGEGLVSDQLRGIPGAPDGVYGGTLPARVWKAFMDAALRGVPKSTFDPPAFGGMVQDNAPPSPSPTITAAPDASQGTTGILGGLFGGGDGAGGGTGTTGGGQQQGGTRGGTRPRQTGIIVDPFAGG
ncbi:transglycosylase domain-containing protein [Frankia umida]|uniref:transglycosylase domain-containing protein n=1 Tax=Frankia umida TaxID=573489 RepID=UPI0027E42C98|nr:transglycosylase domain-containing protein [Frankia umida]